MAKRANTQAGIRPLSRASVASAVFIATCVLALLSFISIEIALMAFAAMAVAAIYYTDRRNRVFQELGAAFKFKTLREAIAAQDRDILRHGIAIDALKEEIKEIRAQPSATQAQVPFPPMESPSEKPAPAPAPARAERPLHDSLAALIEGAKAGRRRAQAEPEAPRAIKPGQSIADAVMPEDDSRETENAATEDYDGLSDTVVRELLHHAVSAGRVDIFVQPVVRLPQRQVRFYEIFARVRARPGQYLPAARYMKIAEQDNLSGEIDTLLLMQCLQTIEKSAHVEKAAPFFLNITTATMKNTAFMKKLLGFLTHNRELASRLVFEMPQEQFEAMTPAMREILRGLGKLGCSFSLDHMAGMALDVEELQAHKVRYVKVGARLLLGRSGNGKEFAALHRAKRLLEANGIGVIVEKIETESMMRDLLDLDVNYGQGYLFGRPELQGAYASRMRARRSGGADEQKARA